MEYKWEDGTLGPDEIPSRWHPVPAHIYIRDAKPTEWVVEERIASRAVTVLAGRAKAARKTLMALYLCHQVAKGDDWIGAKVRRRETVFTGFEGGRSFLGNRFLEIGYSAPLNVEGLEEGISFADGWAGYRDTLGEIERRAGRKESFPVLWVVDTLSQVLAREEVDENDNMAVNRYLSRVDELAVETEAAILFIHHFSKQGVQMRGASAIQGIVNWCEVHCLREREGILRLDWKLRHGPGGSTGVQVHKPNGRFLFDVIDLADLPKDGGRAAKKDGEPWEAIREAVRGALGPVPVEDLLDVVHKATGGKRWAERHLREYITLHMAKEGVPISMVMKPLSWVWYGPR